MDENKVVVVRRDRPNPHLETRLSAVRQVLDNDGKAIEVLGQLLAEYADNHPDRLEEEGTSRT